MNKYEIEAKDFSGVIEAVESIFDPNLKIAYFENPKNGNSVFCGVSYVRALPNESEEDQDEPVMSFVLSFPTRIPKDPVVGDIIDFPTGKDYKIFSARVIARDFFKRKIRYTFDVVGHQPTLEELMFCCGKHISIHDYDE